VNEWQDRFREQLRLEAKRREVRSRPLSEQESRELRDKLLANCVEEQGPLATACWVWMLSARKGGYGQLWTGSRLEIASRAAYLAFIGAIPEDLQVQHLCNNPSCINPAHLILGDQQQNMDYMIQCERRVTLRGEENVKALLTEADVVEILQLLAEGKSKAAVAEQFGVSPRTVRAILDGKSWRHVQGERVSRDERPPRQSQFSGVRPAHRQKGKWTARLRGLHLGTFETEELAALAYNAAVIERGLDRPLNNVQ
jgi:hypothetical protein